MDDSRHSPMRIKLSPDRRDDLVRSFQKFFHEAFDEELSEFRAEQTLDFFVRKLGPPVYNQAVRDAYAFFMDKVADLEGEVYEPEDPRPESDE